MEEIRAAVTGKITLDNAGAHHLWSAKVASGKRLIFDFADLSSADSSCIALMVSLRRNAGLNDSEAVFVNVPHSLRKLARLYGIEQELFGNSEPATQRMKSGTGNEPSG